MDPAEAKRIAEDLVRTAETLVAKAREEAASIVADAQRQVTGLLADADALRSAAERDAQSTRADADALLVEAREKADTLLAEARTARQEAVDAARHDLQHESAGTVPASDTSVEDASRVADRILRVARSEAEARRREIVEEATRRAETLEREARARTETASKEYREMVRAMQARELGAKARIRELEIEIARVERLLERVTEEAVRKGVDTDPAADPFEPREVTASGIVIPVSPAEPRHDTPRPAPVAPQQPASSSTRPLERLSRELREVDAETARRAIRRRA